MVGAADAPPPLELRPYRVVVSVAFAPHAMLNAEFRAQVLREVEELTERTYYRMWDPLIEENTWVAPAGARGLERLAADEVQIRFADRPELDKVFLVTVELDGSRYIAATREWDGQSRQIGAADIRNSPVRERIASTIMQTLLETFRPVLSVESADAATATLRLRAAALPPSDPAATQLEPGDLLHAFFRYQNSEGVVQKVQTLPWTYLAVANIDRERVTCTVVSGLRAALGGTRRRVETLAIGVRAAYDATDLQLTRSGSSQPLAGHQVVVHSKLLPDEESQQPPEVAVTGRRGVVRLERRPGRPLVWLYVHSGEALLARVPYVPGLDRSAMLSVPDDSVRLTGEGELEILQGELVEVIAQRAQHGLRASKLAEDGRFDLAEQELARLRALPGARQFTARLTTIQVPAVEAARAQRNRLAESRMNKLCEEMLVLIGRYLDDDKLRVLEERVAELRGAASKEAP
jgi:hypothetical protein